MTAAKKVSAPKVDTKQIEEAVAAGKQTVEQAVAATKEQVENAVSATKEQFEKASEAVVKSYDDMAAINKESLDVMTKFSETLVKGSEQIGKAYYDFLKSAADTQAETTKALMAAKTVNEIIEIQTDYARTSFDTLVVEGGKFSEMSVKVATDAFEPVQAHMNATVERMIKPIAA